MEPISLTQVLLPGMLVGFFGFFFSLELLPDAK